MNQLKYVLIVSLCTGLPIKSHSGLSKFLMSDSVSSDDEENWDEIPPVAKNPTPPSHQRYYAPSPANTDDPDSLESGYADDRDETDLDNDVASLSNDRLNGNEFSIIETDFRTQRNRHAPSPDELLYILGKNPPPGFLDKKNSSNYLIEELPASLQGSSTSFLYMISNSKKQPLYIVKGIKKTAGEDHDELQSLQRVRRSKQLSHIPLSPDFPIITWPEAVYSYIDTNSHTSYSDNAIKYFSLLNVARGTSLMTLVERGTIKETTNIFYAIGKAIASLNLHMAGLSKNPSIELLNNRTFQAHEDLHWGNIFVHKKPTDYKGHSINLQNTYRVYLIDNESLGRDDDETWYWNILTGKRDNINGQVNSFMGWPLYAWGEIAKRSPEENMALFYNGFIKGYASQFSKPREVMLYLLSKMKGINTLYLYHYCQKNNIPFEDRAPLAISKSDKLLEAFIYELTFSDDSDVGYENAKKLVHIIEEMEASLNP